MYILSYLILSKKKNREKIEGLVKLGKILSKEDRNIDMRWNCKLLL